MRRRTRGRRWVPGSFPRSVADLPAATQTGGVPASGELRRLATVACWTMMDSVQHNFFVTGDGVALRGGVVDYEFVVDRNTWRLDQTRFTEDVTVSGLVVDDFPTLDAVLTVTGPDGRPRSVHITGDFLTFIAGMTITLAVAGRPATFTVPAY